MRKTIFIVCIVIVVNLSAFGQRRLPRIPRPTTSQPVPTSSSAPAPTPTEATPRTAEPAGISGSQKPAVEYQSLMSLRFYEADGGFLIEHLQLVFPPPGISKATLVIGNAGGGEVARVPLRFERLEHFPAFGLLEPDGVPGVVRLRQSGDFLMSVIVDGQTVTTLPFSLKEQPSSDPFKPGSRFVREGPWSDLAYFSVLPDNPDAQVEFNYWISTRELPAGMKRPKVTLHLLANGKEIAASPSPVVPDEPDWYFYQHKDLAMPTVPKNRWLTLADLNKLSGDVALVVKANGQPIKTYNIRVAGGQIQRLPQNALTFEPHANFISPRFVDRSTHSTARDQMFEMYWLKKQ